jgi:hypothetical protein
VCHFLCRVEIAATEIQSKIDKIHMEQRQIER